MEVIGIHKEESNIRLACMKQVRGEISIEFLEKQRDLFFTKKDPFIVTGIEGQDLLLRKLATPLKKERALTKTLPFQLEALIPYQLSEVVVKPIYFPDDEGTEAVFFTVSKKHLSAHIENYDEEGLSPDWVSTTPMALSRFANYVCPETLNLIVFHTGKDKIQIVSIQKGLIASHLTLHLGARDFEGGKDQKLIEKLKREVDRAFCFLDHKNQLDEERKILFCGEMALDMEGLVSDAMNMTPVYGDGRGEHSYSEICRFAIPMGLALDALKNDERSIQFRQGDYISQKGLSFLKKKLLIGAVSACAIFICGAVTSHIYFTHKEKGMIRHIKGLIGAYQTALPSLRMIDTGSKVQEVVDDVNRALYASKGKENYFAPPPLVSDLLAFLSDHPNGKDIEITKVDYELISHPSFDHPREAFLPKVKLHFHTEDAKKARMFHDAIVDDESFVDGSREIDWKRNNEQYEITFYLR